MLLLALSFGAAAQAFPELDGLEAKLHIRPDQKKQYDLAIGATKRALLGVGLAAVQVKDALAKELAKDYPDFEALVRKQNEVLDQTRPLFEEAAREWNKLIKLLDDRQAKIAQAWLHDNLGRFLP